jgi:hypothetical protein
MTKKVVPNIMCIGGMQYKIEYNKVWTRENGRCVWEESPLVVHNLESFGNLAKNPTIEVEDE